ncbi:DUF3108 domain-containing protein [Pseudoduganella sp. RAF53_2]|uniref:DUF3108 domain-containing protein n=1 Tax=unclassified Pseudoduganella TaxID=2637179 RepID=UPI003F97E4A3
MTIVSFFSSRRRVLALCVATVALHLVAIDWLASHVGLVDDNRKFSPAVVKADLRLALPQRVATVTPEPEIKPQEAAPKPKRPHKARPKPAPAPEPLPAPEPQPSEGALTAAATPAGNTSESAPPAPQTSPADQTGAASEPAAVQSAQPDAPQQEDEPSGIRRYKVNLPPPARFEMDVKRTDADGKKWSGSASMNWQSDGSTYKVDLEVGITVLFRINVLTVNSEGTVDDGGISPLTMREKRRNRSETATHFNQKERRITFSASDRSYPLLAGTQDKATVPFQLAAIGRADVNQFGGDIDILVGEDKSATIYRFQLVGEEELETDMGKLITWRLTRPPKPGSYSARLDIWLAPSLNFYPVQIRNTEGNGAVTTETVTKILKEEQ